MESIALPVSRWIAGVGLRGSCWRSRRWLCGWAGAIVGSLSVLRLIAMTTDVSIFALNLPTASVWRWPSTTRC